MSSFCITLWGMYDCWLPSGWAVYTPFRNACVKYCSAISSSTRSPNRVRICRKFVRCLTKSQPKMKVLLTTWLRSRLLADSWKTLSEERKESLWKCCLVFAQMKASVVRYFFSLQRSLISLVSITMKMLLFGHCTIVCSNEHKVKASHWANILRREKRITWICVTTMFTVCCKTQGTDWRLIVLCECCARQQRTMWVSARCC